MLVSRDWLNKYFKEKLPPTAEIAQLLTFHSFEIENHTEDLLDVKVLPDRACYALSHRGIAGEIGALLNKKIFIEQPTEMKESDLSELKISIKNKEVCKRYIGRRIENIQVKESPTWLKEKIQVIGQRSINDVVDSLNYVMFDMGQPMHAFDGDKVKGEISVRYAKAGESIVTLDNKEIKLDESILIIADEEGPIALAGVKGGKKAEVTDATKNIIIESANFDSSLVRRTSVKLGITSDAQKRYENRLTASISQTGIEEVTSLLSILNESLKIGPLLDIYPEKEEAIPILVSSEFINKILGTNIEEEEIISILRRLNIKVEKEGGKLKLFPPTERLDLVLPEDITEEVGRIYGYEKIEAKEIPIIQEENKEVNKTFYYSEKIKNILINEGFSEVFTYALASKGDFEIEKSAAVDKNFVRTNLSDGISKSLELNLYNAPILGINQVRIFEIGKIFPKQGEFTSLCIGIANTKRFKGETVNEQIRQTRENLIQELNAKMQTVCTIDDTGGVLLIKGKAVGKINEIDGIMELNLDKLIENLPDSVDNVFVPKEILNEKYDNLKKYQPISQFPFVLRDIAVFVPDKTDQQEIQELIKNEAGDLLVRIDLFDVFNKPFKETGETKTSYAYNLVFQANDRTLTDGEINEIMTKISNNMATKSWQVR